jgi:TPR repeat protein
MYIGGEGVKQDTAEGLQWYQRAANQGYVPAQYAIGAYYENGWGIEQNNSEAFRWYRKAAAQDYAAAQDKIGFFYENGKGVEASDAEALPWYRKAADQNYGRSKYHIGMFYAEGRGGLSRDPVRAHACIEEARAKGVSDAFRWLANHPLEASDGASYLAAEKERLAAARDSDDRLQSDDSKQLVAFALLDLSWALTLNKLLPDAIAQTDEALKLFPNWAEFEVKRAHALLLLGRVEEAKELYLKHKDEPWSFGETYADVIRNDLAEIRRFGIDTPDMKRIEALLGN